MRVTNAPASRKRRTRMIRAAKGFRMRRSKLYRYASDAVDHGRQYAYRDRRRKKRTFRSSEIQFQPETLPGTDKRHGLRNLPRSPEGQEMSRKWSVK